MTDYKIEGNTVNIVNPQGTAANTGVSGIAEFQVDFQSRLASLVEASLSKRPDSIALDYLTAFCLGPVANGDSSQGAIPYVWKCRVDNVARQVLIARENDTKDGWNTESVLFTFDDGLAEINEVDISFEQAGRPVICASRNTGINGSEEVWLYWFDSTDSTFGFDNFGAGRTPRVILDNPLTVTDSDVLFFYLNTTNLVYRQQNERYAVAHNTPLLANSNTFIEDVVKLRSGRIRVEIIRQNAISGKYSIDGLTSTLYPIITSADSIEPTFALISGALIIVIIDATFPDIDSIDPSFSFISGALAQPVISITSFDVDAIDSSFSFVSGTLVDIVIQEILFDRDSIDPSFTFVSGTMIVVIIEYTVKDIDSIDPTFSFISGTLETV